MADFSITIQPEQGTAIFNTNYKSKKTLKLLVNANNRQVAHTVKQQITIPLTFGSGEYTFKLCEQVIGKKYAIKYTTKRKFENDKAYQLSANDYISYNNQSSFFTNAKTLATINNIEAYIALNFQYDTIKAKRLRGTTFTIPDIEICWQTKKGICYDLAALMVAMCRIAGIPSALVVGKANKQPHAWVEFGDGTLCDITKLVTKDKTQYIYIAERYY